MPNKHFYFALGAMHGVVLVYLVRKTRQWLYTHSHWIRQLYRWDRDWFLCFPFAIGLFGVIGLIPDILHALHVLPKEVTRTPFFNLFFFHSSFEVLEDTNKTLDWILNTLGSVVLILISIGILLFYVRLIHEIQKIGGKK